MSICLPPIVDLNIHVRKPVQTLDGISLIYILVSVEIAWFVNQFQNVSGQMPIDKIIFAFHIRRRRQGVVLYSIVNITNSMSLDQTPSLRHLIWSQTACNLEYNVISPGLLFSFAQKGSSNYASSSFPFARTKTKVPEI